MIVLALDPALAHLGYAVVDRQRNGTPAWLDSGTVTTDPRDALPARLLRLAGVVNGLLAHWPIELAIVEKAAILGKYGREKGDSSQGLAIERGMSDFHCARGAILVTLAAAHRQIIEVPASRIPKPGRAARNALVFPHLTKRTSEHERDAIFYAWAAPLPLNVNGFAA